MGTVVVVHCHLHQGLFLPGKWLLKMDELLVKIEDLLLFFNL